MNQHIATVMGRALEQTRAGHLQDATRTLQAALNTKGSPMRSAEERGAKRSPRRRYPLSQVIDALASKPMTVPTRRRRAEIQVVVPEGASFEARRHNCAFGARDFRLFIPSRRGTPIVGLVLMLHGCTQNADDFAAGTQMNLHAERHNLIVVYPNQTYRANQMGCWNWFNPSDQRRDGGEPALLADLAAELAAEFGVPSGHVFAAGLSAGGAMAAILGCTYPEVFSAIGVHSGLAPGSANDIPTAYAAMRGQPLATGNLRSVPVPTISLHGSADTTVAPSNAEAVIAAALGSARSFEIRDDSVAGATVSLHRDARGRTLAESWVLPGVAHAWSGGSPDGSYTEPNGPDASAEIIRFFLSVVAEEQA